MILSNQLIKLSRLAARRKPVGAVMLAIMIGLVAASPALADKYEEQLKRLKELKAVNQAEANELGAQANSIEEQIKNLEAQIAALQAQIDANQAKHDDLVKQIEKAQEELNAQKKVLGKNIKAMYLEGDVSTIEMLASSSNISEFLDKEHYRNIVKDRVAETVKRIADLKKQLAEQRREVSQIIDDQKKLRSDLHAKESEADKKLAETNQKKSEFDQKVNDLSAEIQRVHAEQQAAYAAARQQWRGGYISVGGGGGYPWSGAPYPCWTSSCVDPWMLYYRECTSYTAWRLSSEGYGVRAFNGQGHAYKWPGTTSGYTSQGSTPHAGDAAVIPRHPQYYPYGHVMYVEAVHGDNSITISEYNFVGPGQYSKRKISPAEYGGWTFITFPKV